MDCNFQSSNSYQNKLDQLRKIKDLLTYTRLLMVHKLILFNGHLIKNQNQIFIIKSQKVMEH